MTAKKSNTRKNYKGGAENNENKELNEAYRKTKEYRELIEAYSKLDKLINKRKEYEIALKAAKDAKETFEETYNEADKKKMHADGRLQHLIDLLKKANKKREELTLEAEQIMRKRYTISSRPLRNIAIARTNALNRINRVFAEIESLKANINKAKEEAATAEEEFLEALKNLQAHDMAIMEAQNAYNEATKEYEEKRPELSPIIIEKEARADEKWSEMRMRGGGKVRRIKKSKKKAARRNKRSKMSKKGSKRL